MILTDVDIINCIIDDGLLEKSFYLADIQDKREDLLDNSDSPVQPASLDIHIGEIFVPSLDSKPQDFLILKPGEVVLINTNEKFNVPSNISGALFPAGSSKRGLILANPGILDPGYSGNLRLTLINISKEKKKIMARDKIGTILLFKLNHEPKKSRNDRINNDSNDMKSVLSSLPLDFLRIDKRSKKIVNKKIRDANIIITTVSTILAVILGSVLYGFTFFLNKPITKDLIKLQQQIDSLKLQNHLNQNIKPNNTFIIQMPK